VPVHASAVVVIGDIEHWILWVLYWGLLVLRVWAFVDCLVRKTAAFPAAGKLTKPAWAIITLVSAVIGYFFPPLNLLSFFSLIATLVYLTDVRPAVRQISGGSRW
jgi:Protein of unknown function (DUF2516)